MATFLLVNSYLLEVPEIEVVQIMEGLATDQETQESLAQWLRQNSVNSSVGKYLKPKNSS
jgi:death-on-curing protein